MLSTTTQSTTIHLCSLHFLAGPRQCDHPGDGEDAFPIPVALDFGPSALANGSHGLPAPAWKTGKKVLITDSKINRSHSIDINTIFIHKEGTDDSPNGALGDLQLLLHRQALSNDLEDGSLGLAHLNGGAGDSEEPLLANFLHVDINASTSVCS